MESHSFSILFIFFLRGLTSLIRTDINKKVATNYGDKTGLGKSEKHIVTITCSNSEGMKNGKNGQGKTDR